MNSAPARIFTVPSTSSSPRVTRAATCAASRYGIHHSAAPTRASGAVASQAGDGSSCATVTRGTSSAQGSRTPRWGSPGVVPGLLDDPLDPLGIALAHARGRRAATGASALVLPAGSSASRPGRRRSRRPSGPSPPADPWSRPATPPASSACRISSVSASTAARSRRCRYPVWQPGDPAAGRTPAARPSGRSPWLRRPARPGRCRSPAPADLRSCSAAAGRSGRRRSSAAAAGDPSGRSLRGTAPAIARGPAPARQRLEAGLVAAGASAGSPPPAILACGRPGWLPKPAIANRPSG